MLSTVEIVVFSSGLAERLKPCETTLMGDTLGLERTLHAIHAVPGTGSKLERDIQII